jgi:hypothetical protein
MKDVLNFIFKEEAQFKLYMIIFKKNYFEFLNTLKEMESFLTTIIEIVKISDKILQKLQSYEIKKGGIFADILKEIKLSYYNYYINYSKTLNIIKNQKNEKFIEDFEVNFKTNILRK